MAINSLNGTLNVREAPTAAGPHGLDQAAGRLDWAILDPAAGVLPDDLRREWQILVSTSDHPFNLHQSPEWFDHLTSSNRYGSPYLAYARDASGDIAAVVPITVDRHRLPLHIVRTFQFLTPARPIILIWGGRPLSPVEPAAMEGLIGALLARFPDTGGLDFFGVRGDSQLLPVLEETDSIRRSFLVERRPGVDRIDLIPLPASFELFLAQYPSKKRYNLKRQLRMASESVGGDLVMERIEHPDQVPGFVAAIAALSDPDASDSDQTEGEDYRDLAERGLLLGYVLKAAGQPIACLMGKEYGPTYLVDWTRYNREFHHLSPGTTLLHLAVEDLIAQQRFARINLGYGSAKCEFRSTNTSAAFPSFWLIRKTVATRALILLRGIIRESIASLQGMLRNDRPPAPDHLPVDRPKNPGRLGLIGSSPACASSREQRRAG